MDQRIAFSFTFVPMLLAAIALVASPALGQQGEQTHHRYFVSAELTIEGMKNLQKQSATGLRAGVAEFAEAAECKLESWYFEPGASTARAIVDCSSEIGAAALQVSANAAGFAHVTAKSVLTAEELDKVLAVSADPSSTTAIDQKFHAMKSMCSGLSMPHPRATLTCREAYRRSGLMPAGT